MQCFSIRKPYFLPIFISFGPFLPAFSHNAGFISSNERGDEECIRETLSPSCSLVRFTGKNRKAFYVQILTYYWEVMCE